MWIKICANTNLDDALLAADLGADALGFVFAPSTRQVTAAVVARITPRLPTHIERVGVFYSQSVHEIAGVANEAGLTAIQLHGGVNLPLVTELNARLNGRLSLIQTVHWHIDEDGASAALVARELQQIAAHGLADRVLIDSKVGVSGGGTGVSFNWDAARSVLASAAGNLKLIVAGGLRPENVANAIQRLNPWGVDVASGVESLPGRKDPHKLAHFIRNARQATGQNA